jgi:hypothetical protein
MAQGDYLGMTGNPDAGGEEFRESTLAENTLFQNCTHRRIELRLTEFEDEKIV